MRTSGINADLINESHKHRYWWLHSLVGFLDAPEANLLVVARGGEHLSRGVPGHAPNHLFVGKIYFVEHYSAGRVPVNYLSVLLRVRRTGKQVFFKRMPRDHIDWVVVPFEYVKLLVELSYVVHLDFGVSTACKEPVAVDRVPPDLGDGVVVRWDCVNSLAASARVPHFDVGVLAARDHQTFKGMPVA